jgi:hypothetical protein
MSTDWNTDEYWEQHSFYTHAWWQSEVANLDTLQGYHDWVRAHLIEDEAHQQGDFA